MTSSDTPQRIPNVTHTSDSKLAPARLRGFTLVELLVVIVIITLLASILAPFIQGASEQAFQAKCRGKLQKLHGAAAMYGSANHNRIPVVHQAMEYGAIGKILASGGRFAEKYMGQSWKVNGLYANMADIDNAFQCPGALDNADHFNKRQGTNYRLSGFGLDLGGGDGLHPLTMVTGGTVQSKSGTKVHPAGEVAMAIDWIWASNGAGLGAGYQQGKSLSNHPKGANVLYGSGSVKWVSYNSMVAVPAVDGLIIPPGTYGFIDSGTNGTHIAAPCGEVIQPSGGKGNKKPGAGVMW
jgi:prepilin-type N-terminal cleavage/methylation domain-containing protein